MAVDKHLRVLITGAAGQIAYSLIPMVSSGLAFGLGTSVDLVLLDLPAAEAALAGVIMEVNDCAFPLVKSVVGTSDQTKAFTDIDVAILVGAVPRRDGMVRADLLNINKAIFEAQGKLLDTVAKKTVKVVVVGNPANTNCHIAMMNAPSIDKRNFSALSRLDHNRLLSQVAGKLDIGVQEISQAVVWGNHSSTQYPDLSHALLVSSGQKVLDVINDSKWSRETVIVDVQKRGDAIIKARKLSSAVSAARAVVDHLNSWFLGTDGKWVSMCIASDGSYGIEKDLVFSYPVTCSGGDYQIVQGLSLDEFSKKMIDTTHKELVHERDSLKK